jgi:hypothetical protein
MSAACKTLAGAASNGSVCWLPRSNVQVIRKTNAGHRVREAKQCVGQCLSCVR